MWFDKKKKPPLTNIDLQNFCFEFTPAEFEFEFTNATVLPLLDKLSLEKKEIMLMGDFNINLLHSDVDKETSNFMDNKNSFFPTIILPTRITTLCKTFIGNIFYNNICKKIKVEILLPPYLIISPNF